MSRLGRPPRRTDYTVRTGSIWMWMQEPPTRSPMQEIRDYPDGRMSVIFADGTALNYGPPLTPAEQHAANAAWERRRTRDQRDE